MQKSNIGAVWNRATISLKKFSRVIRQTLICLIMKSYWITLIILFFALLSLGLFVHYGFLSGLGCVIGFAIGNFYKQKKNKSISTRTLYSIITLAITSLALTAGIYYFMKDEGVYYIIVINVLLLAVSIALLIKSR